jgi:AraC family transcriptional regulator
MMDWQERMSAAIAFLESRLNEPLDLEAAGQKANCSAFHFMRMFEVITGISPAEYVRRRRLSIAGLELASEGVKVIDVAMKFGYESPDAFTRAFRREFGCLPSDAKQPGARLHSYPPLSFSIALQGDKAMEYRIEKGPEYHMTGLSLKCNEKNGENFKIIPEFWKAIMTDGRCEALGRKAKAPLGIVGICHSHDMATGNFVYTIGIRSPLDRSGLPKGCDDLVIPASTWAKFTSRGPLDQNFQGVIKRIFSEWFPASGKEHAGTAEIEFYPEGLDTSSQDYWCEYWVPIK